MIYRYLILGLAAATLLLSSCQQEELQPTAQEQAQEYEYVELDLSSGAEQEDFRLFFSHDDSSPTPKFNLSFGANGDKVKVRTYIYTDEQRVNPATQNPENYLTIFFNEVLDWTVDRDGKGLIYKGKIRLPKEAISYNGTIYLFASTGEEDESHIYRTTARLMPLRSYTRLNPLELKIPFATASSVQLSWANYEKRNRLVNMQPRGTQDSNSIEPMGDVVMVTIKNHLSTPISPTRLRYNGGTPSRNGIQVLVGLNLDVIKPGFSTSEMDIQPAYDKTAVGSSSKPEEAKYYYDYFPDGASIAPGATEHYFVWYPNFTGHQRFRSTSTFFMCEFLEADATEKARISSYPSGIPDYGDPFNRMKVLRWTFEVGQP